MMFPLRSFLLSSSVIALSLGTIQMTLQHRSLGGTDQPFYKTWIRNTIAAPVQMGLEPGTCEPAEGCMAPVNAPCLPQSLDLAPIAFPLWDPLKDPLRDRSPDRSSPASPQSSPEPPQDALKVLAQGNALCVNDRLWRIPWVQVQRSGQPPEFAVADFGLLDHLHLNLLDTQQAETQPVEWFNPNATTDSPLSLDTLLSDRRRYLSLSPLLTVGGWQAKAEGGLLSLTVPGATVQGLRFAQRDRGYRAVLELDRPAWVTPTPLSGNRWQFTLEGSLSAAFSDSSFNRFLQQDPLAQRLQWQMTPIPQSSDRSQVQIQITLPAGLVPTLSRLPNPHRLVLDLQPRSFQERTITWAPGILWQQRWLNLGNKSIPIVQLQIQPDVLNAGQWQLRPLLPPTPRSSLAQTQPLGRLVDQSGAIVAMNAGFFNRDNQLPLGAVREGGEWISGPILNRGVIAWQPQPFKLLFDRLTLAESVTVEPAGQTLGQPVGQQTIPLTSVNSGYVKAGIARYTPLWGDRYTTLIDGEKVLTVENDRITAVQTLGKAGSDSIAIPPNGYLLAARASQTLAQPLAQGVALQLQQTYQPPTLAAYPQIVGAGPLLVKGGKVVLDAAGEGFSPAFIRQAALRSAMGQTATGDLLWVAVALTPGGDVPTLAEMATIMLNQGAIDAVNLDGGSSSSLYLGGRVLNRPSGTAARIHNGIGVVYRQSRER